MTTKPDPPLRRRWAGPAEELGFEPLETKAEEPIEKKTAKRVAKFYAIRGDGGGVFTEWSDALDAQFRFKQGTGNACKFTDESKAIEFSKSPALLPDPVTIYNKKLPTFIKLIAWAFVMTSFFIASYFATMALGSAWGCPRIGDVVCYNVNRVMTSAQGYFHVIVPFIAGQIITSFGFVTAFMIGIFNE